MSFGAQLKIIVPILDARLSKDYTSASPCVILEISQSKTLTIYWYECTSPTIEAGNIFVGGVFLFSIFQNCVNERKCIGSAKFESKWMVLNLALMHSTQCDLPM